MVEPAISRQWLRVTNTEVRSKVTPEGSEVRRLSKAAKYFRMAF